MGHVYTFGEEGALSERGLKERGQNRPFDGVCISVEDILHVFFAV